MIAGRSIASQPASSRGQSCRSIDMGIERGGVETGVWMDAICQHRFRGLHSANLDPTAIASQLLSALDD